ncbi:MAG: exosortase K [Spirochaetia bacterium]|jgi:exosortase K|nr:exosortase K [Spirochaetia bacterium]
MLKALRTAASSRQANKPAAEGRNTACCAAVIALLLALKYAFSAAGPERLFFLLKPTAALVGLVTAARPVCVNGEYYFESLNVLVGKSCSGFNLWLICFAMLSFLLLQYMDSYLRAAASIAAALLLSYIFTIMVNSSRILASMFLSQTPLPDRIMHESIGIVTNMVFLAIIYFLTENFMKRRGHKHEESL